MKTKYIIIGFVVVAIIQLAIPTQMIFKNEDTLSTGTIYKFNTRPVDPNDPFRGKYITLRYRLNSAATNDTTWQRKDEIYVYIEEDSLGFASVKTVSKTKLNIKQDYVLAKVNWYNKKKQKVNFGLPFNRFYMNEFKAKPAEDVYRDAQRDSLPNNTYALVAIKEDNAVLKDVIINDSPIEDYIKEVKVIK